MLRLLLLLLYLAASYASTPAQPQGDLTGNLDPNGRTARVPPPTADAGGGWDPNG